MPGSDLDLAAGLAVIALVTTVLSGFQKVQLNRTRQRLHRSEQRDLELMSQHGVRLDGLLTVSRTLATATDPQTVFDCITNTCQTTFDGEQNSLMLLDRSLGDLVVRAATGHLDPANVLGRRTPLGKGIAGWVGQSRKPLILGKNVDASLYPGFRPPPHSMSAAMVVPILVRDDLVGVLNVGSRAEVDAYSEEDLQALMVFAETAGIACRHAEQSDWMRQTIQRLDHALQERDGASFRRAA